MAPTDKLVLLALADCANDEGHCWPSIATIARKSGVSERSVQRAIRHAEMVKLIKRDEVIGRGCNYRFLPRQAVTPDNVSPATNETPTPDTVSPKPSGTTIPKKDKPSLGKRPRKQAPEVELPDDWQPQPFGTETQCRAIEDGWPPGERIIQLEHFRAHHTRNGDRFRDWQAAWRTWVLNSRKFRNGKQPDHQIRTSYRDPILGDAFDELRSGMGQH